MDQENPARRLHRILLSAVSKPDGQPIVRVWSEVLGGAPGTTEQMRKMLALRRLVARVQSLVVRYSDNKPRYLSPFESVFHAISFTELSGQWGNVKNHLNAEVLTRLEFCDDLLESSCAEGVATKEQLAEIVENLEDLDQAIKGANLGEPLTSAFRRIVEEMRDHLDDYEIEGLDGLRGALAAGYGELLSHHDLMLRSSNKESIKEMVVKFATPLSMLANLLTILSIAGPPLLDTAQDALRLLDWLRTAAPNA